MYDIEKYYQAASAADAAEALRRDPDAIPVAGGTDVLIQIREGRHAGCSLVSLHGIPELSRIEIEDDGTIVIGSGCVFSQIENSPLLRPRIGVLCGAVGQVGGPQIRNMGTIGGNVCNGVTSADSACSLMALDAEFELLSPDGSRRVAIGEWYTGPGKTVRKHDEVLTFIRIFKENYEGYGAHYIKYGKRAAMEISTLGCAVNVKLTDDKKEIADMRIAFGVAAPTPIRCPNAEKLALGQRTDENLVKEIGSAVLKEISPRDSWRASKQFRMQIAKEICRRALRQAVVFAGGEICA